MEAIPATSRAIRAFEAPRLVVGLGACVAVLSVLGAYDALVAELPPFNLQREPSTGLAIPTMFSGAMLLLASALCARLGKESQTRRWVWIGLAAFGAFMAVDEVLALHEDLQKVINLKWQLLYAPLFLVAAALWAVVLRLCSDWRQRVLWIAGAAGWALAQVINTVAHLTEGDDPLRPRDQEAVQQTSFSGALRGFEEVLELSGTVFFIWALLLFISRFSADTAAPARSTRSPSLDPVS